MGFLSGSGKHMKGKLHRLHLPCCLTRQLSLLQEVRKGCLFSGNIRTTHLDTRYGFGKLLLVLQDKQVWGLHQEKLLI